MLREEVPLSLLAYYEEDSGRRLQGRAVLESMLPADGLDMAYVELDSIADSSTVSIMTCGERMDGVRHCCWRGGPSGLDVAIHSLACTTDLVVIEGARAGLPFAAAEVDARGLVDSPAAEIRRIIGMARKRFYSRPVWAVILIGGKSSRMGRPKHLLPDLRGKTWLEHSVDLLRPLVAGIALAGGGEVPPTCRDLIRLSDLEGVGGPLAGILPAMRWRPDVAWLVLACDMPGADLKAVQWLLGRRDIRHWAVVPRIGGQGQGEPLFAVYEPQSFQQFEQMVDAGDRRVRLIVGKERVHLAGVPSALCPGWRNVNTPEELQRFCG